MDDYVLTVTARETLGRLISALENQAASKAWALTVPYGSGKSAFALFAAKLLGEPESPATQEALHLLNHGNVLLWNQFADVRATAVRSKEVSIPFSAPENVHRLPLRKHIHVDCH